MVSYRVDDIIVADLEYTVAVDAGLCCAACFDDGLFSDVADIVRVVLILGHGDGIFVVDSILVAVKGGIDSEGKHVLVEWRHNAWTNVGPPRNSCARLFVVKGNG